MLQGLYYYKTKKKYEEGKKRKLRKVTFAKEEHKKNLFRNQKITRLHARDTYMVVVVVVGGGSTRGNYVCTLIKIKRKKFFSSYKYIYIYLYIF